LHTISENAGLSVTWKLIQVQVIMRLQW